MTADPDYLAAIIQSSLKSLQSPMGPKPGHLGTKVDEYGGPWSTMRENTNLPEVRF